MRKRLLKGYVLVFLVLILYITVIISFPKTVMFWIAAGFTVPAFFAQLFTLSRIDKQAGTMKDRALDFPKLRISVLYLAVQLSASLLLMLFAAKIPVFAAAAIEIIILLAAVAGFFAVEAACAEIIRQNAKTRDAAAFLLDLKERLNRLILHCGQERFLTELRRLAEEIQFSHPLSAENTQEIEEEIASLLTELENAALAENADTVSALCSRMTALFKERDRIIKDRR